MKQTPNYNLKKPELTDSPPDITATNPNWDLLDQKLKETEDALNNIEAPVKSVNNKTGNVNLTATDVGAVSTQTFSEHKADYTQFKEDTETEITDLKSSVNNGIQSVANGKTELATALVGKGVSADGSETFSELAGKIGQIPVGDYKKGDEIVFPHDLTLLRTMGQDIVYSSVGGTRAYNPQATVFLEGNNSVYAVCQQRTTSSYFIVRFSPTTGSIIYEHELGTGFSEVNIFAYQSPLTSDRRIIVIGDSNIYVFNHDLVLINTWNNRISYSEGGSVSFKDYFQMDFENMKMYQFYVVRGSSVNMRVYTFTSDFDVTVDSTTNLSSIDGFTLQTNQFFGGAYSPKYKVAVIRYVATNNTSQERIAVIDLETNTRRQAYLRSNPSIQITSSVAYNYKTETFLIVSNPSSATSLYFSVLKAPFTSRIVQTHNVYSGSVTPYVYTVAPDEIYGGFVLHTVNFTGVNQFTIIYYGSDNNFVMNKSIDAPRPVNFSGPLVIETRSLSSSKIAISSDNRFFCVGYIGNNADPQVRFAYMFDSYLLK